MNWTEIIVNIATQDSDTAQAIAAMTVPYGFYVEDYADMEITLPEIGCVDDIEQSLLDKDKTRVLIHLYIPVNANPAETILYLKQRLTAENIAHKIDSKTINEADWENNWKQYYKAQHIGRRLVVCPSWEHYDPKTEDVVLTLDPGTAFGTGQHETTQLCLELLEDNVQPGDKILDLGTGSGILSIAALKLGAKSASVVDVDKNAVATACRNALENAFGAEMFMPYVGNVLEDTALAQAIGGGYDLIVANIVADIIIAMKHIFYNKLKEGKPLIVSGIIDTRLQEVEQELMAAGFALAAKRELRGWVALQLHKK